MTDNQAYAIENRSGFQVRFIDSEAKGLKYAVDSDKLGILIAGRCGKTGLTIKQANFLVRELPEILREMGCLQNEIHTGQKAQQV